MKNDKTAGRTPWFEGRTDDGLSWSGDGALELLRVRARGILAAAFSERSWQSHPWESQNWYGIASATNRVLALFREVRSTTNRIYGLPALEFEVSYPADPGYNVKLPFNGQFRKAVASRITIQGTYEGGRQCSVVLRWKQEDDWILDYFQDFISQELKYQLTLPADLHARFAARPDAGQKHPRNVAEELWDFRVRFSDFQYRFLSCFRGDCGLDVHPFLTFFLKPRTPQLSGATVPSGFFGYQYFIDGGQTGHLRQSQRLLELDAVGVLSNSYVHFPWGVCSRVYLGAQAMGPQLAPTVFKESPPELAAVEAAILGMSTLMEIPVYFVSSAEDSTAADGPELILCVCLPSRTDVSPAAFDDGAATNSQPCAAVQTSGNAPESRHRIRIEEESRAFPGSSFLEGEAQFVREMAQRELARYSALKWSEKSLEVNLVGRSERMQQIRQTIQQASVADETTVMVIGKSGTGKELVAKLIHQQSPRSSRPFVALSCANLAADTLESDLFGHDAHAFTGAVDSGFKEGLLDTAHNGTLFLDEIDKMDRAIQAKFLRVLEERKFKRKGGREDIEFKVRVISATNIDLYRECKKDGGFREDLYHRLKVIRIQVPELNERREDVPLLIDHFVSEFRSKQSNKKFMIEPAAIDAIAAHAYTWPGNVRELRNYLEATFATNDSHITSETVERTLNEWIAEQDTA